MVEFTSAICTVGGKIRPSRVILKDSVNSFGATEVVEAGAVALVAVAVAVADRLADWVTCLWSRAASFGSLYAEMQGVSAAADKRRMTFRCIAVSEKKEQR